MAWECQSCHRSFACYPDPRGCDDEPICWHCLYEHREALLEACGKGRAWFKSETALEEISDVIKSFDEAIKAAKGR